ncbi:MAG: hypothetical protein Rhims3KO_01170 [Hyphomicrobiales bacterium]
MPTTMPRKVAPNTYTICDDAPMVQTAEKNWATPFMMYQAPIVLEARNGGQNDHEE